MEPNLKRENDSFPHTGPAHISTRDNIHPIKEGVTHNEERESWKNMAQNLYRDIAGLWEKESQLIRTEMSEKLGGARKSIMSLTLGGAFLFYGGFSLVVAAIIALNFVLQLWAAAAVVGAVLLVIGGIITMSAKKKLEADNLKPKHSIEAFGEISTTLKEKFHDIRKH